MMSTLDMNTEQSSVTVSDVKFHEIFWREIFHEIFRELFHEIFRELFLRYLKKITMDYGCRLYSSLQQSKYYKPVKGKYLLLCMNSIMHFLLTSYTLILFLKVLSHFIMKIKIFVTYFKEGS